MLARILLQPHVIDILGYIAEFPSVTAHDISEELDKRPRTVHRYLQMLRFIRAVRISRWGPRSDLRTQQSVPHYSIGVKPDAERPKFTPEKLRESQGRYRDANRIKLRMYDRHRRGQMDPNRYSMILGKK